MNNCKVYAGIIRKPLVRKFLYADVIQQWSTYIIQYKTLIRVNVAPGGSVSLIGLVGQVVHCHPK